MEEYWTVESVEARMVEAIGFLDRVSGGGRNPYAGDGPWSQIVRDRLIDYVDVDDLRERGARARGGLNAAEVDRMSEALDWIRHVPAKGGLRRLVGMVLHALHNGGSRPDWALIRRRMGTKDSVEALRKGYARSMTRIAERLNAGK